MPTNITVGQAALWFLHDLAPESAAYNVAFALRILDPVDTGALEQAVRRTARRHDMLRSSFSDVSGQPERVVHGDDVVRLEVRPARDPAAQVRAVIAEPFRLREAPLVRFVLLRDDTGGDTGGVLVMVAHHVVLDAGSQTVIMRDLFEEYRALRTGVPARLPELALTYADHVAAERELLASPRLAELTEHWRRFCAGAPVALELPTDRPRPAVQRYVGSAVSARLPEDAVADVQRVARELRVTPFAFLVAVFEVLLHRYSGQPDFLLGCATSTKDRRMSEVVGFFVNPVLLRPEVGARTTFRELVAQTGGQLRQGTAYRHHPFALLPPALGVPHDPSRSALFQVLVTAYSAGADDTLLDGLFQGVAHGPFDYAGVRVAAVDMPPQQTGQFDLTLELHMSKRSVTATLKYATALFDAATVERLARQYLVLVQSACADPDELAGRLPMMAAEERELLLSAVGGDALDW
ncbi:hypothetical protein JOF41_002961 [Saccharothrix coeruleofusca]|uniref:condensation domain-containing protein n=1 Tax=Saccharothrix coeruleofusca TaxID=33919 RepID=UPI001AEA7D28|nr:condensation domain-containing protein [Saccharothrix coeruleofusca]MBP2336783.1 hypothetical protein [Saccharothrix coeruleofusca]